MASRAQTEQDIRNLIPDNMTKAVSAADVRNPMIEVLQFADTVQTELRLEDTRIEGRVDVVIGEVGAKTDSQDQDTAFGRIKNTGEDVKELKRINEEVTDPALALLPDLRTDVDAANDGVATNTQGLIDANSRIDGISTDGTPYDDSVVKQDILDNNAMIVQEVLDRSAGDTALGHRIDGIPLGANTEQIEKINKNAEDILTEKGRIDEIIANPGSGVSEAKVQELIDAEADILEDEIQANRTTGADFVIRSGVTPAFAPSVFYRGTGDQDYFNAQQANIPGLIFQRASGSFVIPAVTLTDIPAGTRFRWSGAYLNPGKTGRQSGFDPFFYYVIEQGVNRLVGSGTVGSSDDLDRNWALTQGIDNSTELVTDLPVTGTDIIVRWIAIYGGEDATLRPSLSAGDVSFVGELEPFVEHIVHDVTDARFNDLEGDDQRLLAGLEGANTSIENNRTRIDSADGLIQGIRDTLSEPQFQAIEEATIVASNTQTLDATELNATTLGASGKPFARNFDDAIGEATQFITRFVDSHQVLDYGAGRIADVYDGHIRIFQLVPARDEQTNTNTRYITTRSGYGTRIQPAVLEFGSLPPGQTVKQAAETEVFLDTGIPASVLPTGTTISNVSMAFAVRTNGNWNTIANTLQFAIRSGEVRTFAIPAPIREMTFRATGLTDGRIHCESLHNRSVGESNDIVTNAGAIRFDAAYVETVVTPAVPRGQETVDGGVFTGSNLIAIDVGQTGDSDTLTATIVTPTGTHDSGYFLRDIHRTNFREENQAFEVFVSDADTALTPDVLSQLDGTDRYLGLFARTNHHDDAFQFAHGVIVPTSDGSKTYNVGDQLELLSNAGGSGSGLSTQDVQGIADTAISQSLADKGAIANAISANVGIKFARIVLGGASGNPIANAQPVDDNTGSVGNWQGRSFVGAIAKVITPSTENASSISIGIIGFTAVSTASLPLSGAGETRRIYNIGTAMGNFGSNTNPILGVGVTGGTPSSDCQIELVVAYLEATDDEYFAGSAV